MDSTFSKNTGSSKKSTKNITIDLDILNNPSTFDKPTGVSTYVLSKLFNISERTVRRRLDDNQIIGNKYGGKLLFNDWKQIGEALRCNPKRNTYTATELSRITGKHPHTVTKLLTDNHVSFDVYQSKRYYELNNSLYEILT
jgi:hypothetical protein